MHVSVCVEESRGVNVCDFQCVDSTVPATVILMDVAMRVIVSMGAYVCVCVCVCMRKEHFFSEKTQVIFL